MEAKETLEKARKALSRRWWNYLIAIITICAVVSALYAIGLHLYYHDINYAYRHDKNAKKMILKKGANTTTIDFNKKSISVNQKDIGK